MGGMRSLKHHSSVAMTEQTRLSEDEMLFLHVEELRFPSFEKWNTSSLGHKYLGQE